MRLLPLAFLLLPLLEIATFIGVGGAIGLLPTLGLIVFSGLVGIYLLRVRAPGMLTRMRADLAAGRQPGETMAEGATIVLAAILLILPGFLTDLVAVALLLKPVRQAVWRLLRSRVTVRSTWARSASPNNTGGSRTIDLDADDYSRTSDNTSSPWRRNLPRDKRS